MENLSKAGRIFYGIAIAGIGLVTVCYHAFPYILQLPEHVSMPAQITLAVAFGVMFVVAGLSIVLQLKPREVSLLFGGMLLLLFCLYYIPYEFLVSKSYMKFEDWENAEKELTFAGGAFVVAGCYAPGNEGRLIRLLGKLIPFGAILYAITIICYGTLHFLEAKEASDYVPAWIPYHIFWMYFCGAALLASGIAIIFKIKVRLAAGLLGVMIFLWFILLHIPRMVVSPAAYMASEIDSALFALAYSGTAFIISGMANKKASNRLT